MYLLARALERRSIDARLTLAFLTADNECSASGFRVEFDRIMMIRLTLMER
jgi:hypothetical protein